MKIGICTYIENLAVVQDLGFDYFETGVAHMMALEKEEFSKVCETVQKSAVKCEAMNVFFPSEIRIVGPQVDLPAVEDYVRRAFERISLLGPQVVVVGSGMSRNCPEGWDKGQATEQLVNVLRMIGEEARKYGITAVLEPLNRNECNMVNSIQEGLAFVKAANHPNIRLLADFYHMRVESEDVRSLLEASDMLRHVHIANSNGRVFPKRADEDQYAEFFKTLKAIGYNERISIEAATQDFYKDAEASLRFLREFCKEYAN